MPAHDEHTKEFMRSVLGEEQATQDRLKPLRVVKQLASIAQDPRNLGKFIIRKTTKDIMRKEGSLNVLGVYRFMNEHYGREWWDWEPETIWASLEKDHRSEGTPDEIKNMVMALQTVLNTFAPFEHWHVFEKVSHAFNQGHVDFGVVQPTEVNEAAFTMAVLKQIRPNTEYDSEVLQYIAACANISGMVYLPEAIFPGVQKYLDGMTFEHHLRDVTKKVWEDGALPSEDQILLRHQVEIQIARLNDVKDYLNSEIK
jgi:hypothetical protein